jgi:hypothetical protein
MLSGRCGGCGEFSILLPLHGERGGPLRCPLCVGKWNGEHGRRRRLGRIVIRAIIAFLEGGGGEREISKLKESACAAWRMSTFGCLLGLDPRSARLHGQHQRLRRDH